MSLLYLTREEVAPLLPAVPDQLDLVEDICEDVVIIARGRVVAADAIEALRRASGRQHRPQAHRADA